MDHLLAVHAQDQHHLPFPQAIQRSIDLPPNASLRERMKHQRPHHFTFNQSTAVELGHGTTVKHTNQRRFRLPNEQNSLYNNLRPRKPKVLPKPKPLFGTDPFDMTAPDKLFLY